jgi:hypothetical protein
MMQRRVVPGMATLASRRGGVGVQAQLAGDGVDAQALLTQGVDFGVAGACALGQTSFDRPRSRVGAGLCVAGRC